MISAEIGSFIRVSHIHTEKVLSPSGRKIMMFKISYGFYYGEKEDYQNYRKVIRFYQPWEPTYNKFSEIEGIQNYYAYKNFEEIQNYYAYKNFEEILNNCQEYNIRKWLNENSPEKLLTNNDPLLRTAAKLYIKK